MTDTIDEVKQDVEDLRKRLADGDERFESNSSRMDSMDLKLGQIKKNTDELLSIYKSIKGFIRVCGWLWWLGKHLAWIGLVLGAIYAWIKTGDWQPPKPPVP